MNLFEQLKSVDVGQWLKSKMAGKNLSEKLDVALGDSVMGVDKKSLMQIAVGLVVFILGIASIYHTLEGYLRIHSLKSELAAQESKRSELTAGLSKLKADYEPLIARIDLAPKSQADLLQALTVVLGNSGLSVQKVGMGTGATSQLIQVDAQGDFFGLRTALSQLRSLSPAIDMRSLTVTYDQAKGNLKLGMTLAYVTPPKFASEMSTSTNNYAYLDGSDRMRHQILGWGTVRPVQFDPKKDGNAPPSTAPATPAAPAAKAPAKDEGLDRNPFYMPPTAGGGAGAGPVPADSGGPMPVQTARGQGLYVTGCMVPAVGRAVCVFQLLDGTTGVFHAGQVISPGIRLVRVSKDQIVVANGTAQSTYKIGEQIK